MLTSHDHTRPQFYFSEADLGKNRAEVSTKYLRDLNQYVSVEVNNAHISSEARLPLASQKFEKPFCPSLEGFSHPNHAHGPHSLSCLKSFVRIP